VSASTRQWKRRVEIVIGDRTRGQGLHINGPASVTNGNTPLRVHFKITKVVGRTPNTALVQIINLSEESYGKIRGEYDEVLINAGYEGAELLVFRGNIRNVSSYQDGTERITEIDAADGDRDFRNAVMNVSLAAGSTTQQLLDHAVGSFSSTTAGHAVVRDSARIRGEVFSGMTRDVLDDLAADSDAHWSIQDGRLQLVRVDSTLPTEAIVIRGDTGMIGVPEVDNNGIKVRCLLNPRIGANGKVKLDNNNVKLKFAKARLKLPGAKPHKSKTKAKELARLDPDGIYKVLKVEHDGDNMGGPWVSEVFCRSLKQPIPKGKASPAPSKAPLDVILQQLPGAR
jgi:hypothetical protein